MNNQLVITKFVTSDCFLVEIKFFWILIKIIHAQEKRGGENMIRYLVHVTVLHYVYTLVTCKSDFKK